jgi:DNA topoisomerase-1
LCSPHFGQVSSSSCAEEAAERIAKAEAEQAELDGRECPKCGGRLVYKYSRTGSKFIGCAN